MDGYESRLLVIGIFVTICGMSTYKVQECWSNGALGLKAEIDLIFTLLVLVIRIPNIVYIFPFYQSFINPSLQYSWYY